MTHRIRADRLLVARGLFESRAKAQAAIAAGLVTADETPVAKPSDEIAVDARIRAALAHPYVSRGGVKLAAALDHFGIDPAGLVALDVGASTGGFTEVLLLRGAQHVHAIDVGHAQLHSSLRGRSDITVFEDTDIRALDPARLPARPDLIVIDVSFISLKLVLDATLALAKSRARVLALVKPQFEAGPGRRKHGIVRDPAIHAAVCDNIAAAIAALGWRIDGVIPSPIAGGDGNREFFISAQRG